MERDSCAAVDWEAECERVKDFAKEQMDKVKELECVCKELKAHIHNLEEQNKELEEQKRELKASRDFLNLEATRLRGRISGLEFAIRCNGVSGAEVRE